MILLHALPTARNSVLAISELLTVLSLNPGVDQMILLHALPTARNSVLAISATQSHSDSFSRSSSNVK